ncbi:MTH1187 family thiamine-binding protein [Methanosphaera cuniculi]|uniref:Thiamine-binding protein domain-containing protein n=1 Tax=Methanosphaera cuniculi TaxID=1077256 RepID=A0A2A2HB17_9EURY|nr:MTH1187 family thiamine-binding protein [Methanosphaera cuniculi]PAV06612.1 hypothetical protein ASJ82_04065 [Methanosphaera cuniculi]PWL07800.1 hypothetical protein MSCUN_13310 [Methanosphaera cuniculi]
MITADFAILPVGIDDTELKEYVRRAVQVVKDSGLTYQLTAMGTLIEAQNYEELYKTIAKAQQAVFKDDIKRVYTVIKIDDRRDHDDHTLNGKVQRVDEILK